MKPIKVSPVGPWFAAVGGDLRSSPRTSLRELTDMGSTVRIGATA